MSGSFPGVSAINRRELLGSVALCSLFAGSQAIATVRTRTPAPPVTPRRPIRIEQLGRVRIDDYAWLKPANWKDVWRDNTTLDPAIRSHLEEENRYVDAVLEPVKTIQADLLREMKALSPQQLDMPAELDGP